LTFGTGVHHCLGAFLAHAEGVSIVEQFLKRYPDFDLDPEKPARWGVGQVSGMQEVPIVVKRK
jgi:cytochrome P450